MADLIPTVLNSVSAWDIASTTLLDRTTRFNDANLIPTALNPVSARDTASSMLLDRMARFNGTALTEQQDIIGTRYQARINPLGRETTKWQDLRSGLVDVQTFLDAIVRRIDRISDLGMNMLTTVFKSTNGTEISALSYEAQFNSYLKSWNTEADDRGGSPNLIGSTPQRTYSYVTGISGATRTVSRYDLSSGYYIIDSNGFRWERDTVNGSFLRQIDETTGARTGNFTSITGGIELDSLVGDAVTFTIKPDTSDAETITGTLYRTGLGVLDAWLYDGLTTDAGRIEARSDVYAARSMVKAQLARFQAELTSLEFYQATASNNMSGLANRIDSLTTAMALELQEAQDEAARISSTNLLVVSQAQLIRDTYLEAYSLGRNSEFARALIDVLA